jgi:hypothetical protein
MQPALDQAAECVRLCWEADAEAARHGNSVNDDDSSDRITLQMHMVVKSRLRQSSHTCTCALT